MRLCVLLSVISAISSNVASTAAESTATQADSTPQIQKALPEIDTSDFHSIFDGQTLNNWDGDPTYWSVQNGILTGTITPQTLLKKNSWIVYRGELVEDFELVLDYRVSAKGNSGVGYRLAVLENDPFSVRGPQADIHGLNNYTGICYEENGRRLLAARGQSTWLNPNELPKLAAQLADPAELQSVVRKEDWNRYHLIVKGHHAQHFLNGVLMSEVRDYDNPNRIKQGLIGVQVHVGPPMTIEYRNILLKHIGSAPEGDAGRGHGEYTPGSLSEPEHVATFNHLAEQAMKMTAPRSNIPVDDQEQLTITTNNIGTVRSDLQNVTLGSDSRPLPQTMPVFDLIIRKEDLTLRVPEDGGQFAGKPLNRNYTLQLQWNSELSGYRLTDLKAVE